MKHFVIGTAGHVDHGKTMLVKALTGVDTDRLKEEKERGISIELGFAHLELPGGFSAGIVDVPGHERFIKNMLAGVGGIDLVLLVIAADEGIMPQTREHLDIIQLLQIKKGVVAITKIDLVDEEFLGLVREEVDAFLKGTVLEGAPVVNVSAVTGEGLDELRAALVQVAAEIKERSSNGQARLPVDRCFTVTGFGTVVTGTLVSGQIRTGDSLVLLPRGLITRVRAMQVHGQKVEVATAGQRVALNLTKVEVEQVKRGDVLAAPGSLKPSYLLDVKLTLLKSALKPLKNHTRVRVYQGTAEVLGRVVLLDRDELEPGEVAYAQLKLEREIVAAKDDRFVIRSFSPMLTIGGGTVIDPTPRKHKRKRPEVLAALATREKGTPVDQVRQFLDTSTGLHTAADIGTAVALNSEEVASALRELSDAGEIKTLAVDNQTYFLSSRTYRRWAEELSALVREYNRSYPLREGYPKEELRSRKFPGLSNKLYQSLLKSMEEDGFIKIMPQSVSGPDFEPAPTAEQVDDVNYLERRVREGAYQPPSWNDLCRELNLSESQAQEYLQFFIRKGVLVKIGEGLYFHREALTEASQKIRDYLLEKEEITVGEARDLLKTSRKFALPLLEYLDRQRITRRVGDVRVLNKG